MRDIAETERDRDGKRDRDGEREIGRQKGGQTITQIVLFFIISIFSHLVLQSLS